MSPETLPLIAALADIDNRAAAARRLALHVGASALVVLVKDIFVDAYIPATGFSSLPGGSGWRDLLSRVNAPGSHRGRVAYPTRDVEADALAYGGWHVVLVFIGGTPDAQRIDELATLLPLIGALLRAEHDAMSARGDQRVALNYAREAGALAMALDTARSDLERTLRELEDRSRALDGARERAERAVRAKDEFLAMLGHELRNPLSPIVTAIQLMRLKGQSGREVDIIERQVANVVRLVDDLLDVSRLTTGKIGLQLERTEIAEVASRAIEMVSPLLERKRQMLSVDIPAKGLVVDADPPRLVQVLANLLNNAAKYSDEESTIVLTATGSDTHVCVTVKDEGIGIPQHMLERVFELFEQQPQAIDRSQGGLGLGLAIVRSLVTMHGGTVKARSKGEGRGSEFVIELPRAAVMSEDAPRIDDAAPQRLGEGARVLVVDDNADARSLLADALTANDYVVKTASDGPEALVVAAEFQPDIAVLDIGLPVMDGYELAARLRESAKDNALRLVAVTGYGHELYRRRSQLAGFDAHLTKPISLDELGRVLSTLLPVHDRRT